MALEGDAGQVHAAVEDVFGGAHVVAHFVICVRSFVEPTYTLEMLAEIFIAHLDNNNKLDMYIMIQAAGIGRAPECSP